MKNNRTIIQEISLLEEHLFRAYHLHNPVTLTRENLNLILPNEGQPEAFYKFNKYLSVMLGLINCQSSNTLKNNYKLYDFINFLSKVYFLHYLIIEQDTKGDLSFFNKHNNLDNNKAFIRLVIYLFMEIENSLYSQGHILSEFTKKHTYLAQEVDFLSQELLKLLNQELKNTTKYNKVVILKREIYNGVWRNKGLVHKLLYGYLKARQATSPLNEALQYLP